jgi:hypothetical protein
MVFCTQVLNAQGSSIKSCKANGFLNIALSERWSATETDSAEGKIYDKVSRCIENKTPRTIDLGNTYI